MAGENVGFVTIARVFQRAKVAILVIRARFCNPSKKHRSEQADLR